MGLHLSRNDTYKFEGLKTYLEKFDACEVEVLKKVYKELSARSVGNGIDKETFLQYFPLPGLWGERLFQRFDYKGKGFVDYEEFLIGIAVCCRGTKNDRIRVLFDVFDLNNDGYIQKSELVAMLSNLPGLPSYVDHCHQETLMKTSASNAALQALKEKKQYPSCCREDEKDAVPSRFLSAIKQYDRNANLQNYEMFRDAAWSSDSPSQIFISEESRKLFGFSSDEKKNSETEELQVPSKPNFNGKIEHCFAVNGGFSKDSSASSLTDGRVQSRSADDALLPEDRRAYFPGSSGEAGSAAGLSPDKDNAVGENPHFSYEGEEKRNLFIRPFNRQHQNGQLREKRNSSIVAQLLLHQEEEESLNGQLDVDNIVDNIFEECEFIEEGHLSVMAFKAWLEKHESILMMFIDCLHEEVWGLQGNALYRSTPIHNRPEFISMNSHLYHEEKDTASTLRVANSIKIKMNRDVRADELYKIKRLFIRRPAALSAGSSNKEPFAEDTVSPGRQHQRSLSGEYSPARLTETAYCGKPLEPGDFDMYPAVSDNIFSEELLRYIEDSTDKSKISYMKSHAVEGGNNGTLFCCPNCNIPFLRCPFCSRKWPTLKIEDYKIYFECLQCVDSSRKLEACWGCGWEFSGSLAMIDKSEPIKDGILYKIGKHLHLWKARYFVLIDNLLYYYMRKEDAKPKGFIFLEGCYVESLKCDGPQNAKNLGFSICLHGGKDCRRTFFARDTVECQEWMDALRSSMRQKSLADIYHIYEQIGHGKFSSVYRGVHRSSRAEYAIKIIDKCKISLHERELLRSEMAILRLLKHPNVIYLKDILDTKDHLNIAMELVKGGELYDLLYQNQRLPELFTNRIITQLLKTVRYLHKCGIVHRDLKPENILLNNKSEDAIVKLTDFGLSTLCGPNEVLFQPCGTLAYVAPEVLTLKGYNHKVDVWSIGVIMYLLLRGRLPFVTSKAVNQTLFFQQYLLKFEGSIWKKISSSAKDLIRKMLEPNPAARISVDDALQHIWVRNPTAVISEASPERNEEDDETGHQFQIDNLNESDFCIDDCITTFMAPPLVAKVMHTKKSLNRLTSTKES